MITVYSDSEEVVNLAKRIKVMVPGGRNLRDDEAQALAQVSLATQSNPFIGEVWYIPGSGPMLGIKRLRRIGDEQIKESGGNDAFYQVNFYVCSPEEAGVPDNEIKDVVSAVRAELTDSVSTTKHQKIFLEMVNTFREAKDPDPVGNAREILGSRPKWIGYGYSLKGERTKMNKQLAARKRAEADTLKQRFSLPFGVDVAAADVAQDIMEDWVDAEPANLPKPSEQETKAIQDISSGHRPYTPEQLKQRIQLFANENQRQEKLNANEKQRGLVAGVLNECFAGNSDSDKIRHSVLKYLTGYNSLGKDGAPGIYVLALLDWLAPVKDSGGAYHPEANAQKEANSVWTQVLKDAGQMELGVS
jgi:hypothetical protein